VDPLRVRRAVAAQTGDSGGVLQEDRRGTREDCRDHRGLGGIVDAGVDVGAGEQDRIGERQAALQPGAAAAPGMQQQRQFRGRSSHAGA
jgi:hypothetical protein